MHIYMCVYVYVYMCIGVSMRMSRSAHIFVCECLPGVCICMYMLLCVLLCLGRVVYALFVSTLALTQVFQGGARIANQEHVLHRHGLRLANSQRARGA